MASIGRNLEIMAAVRLVNRNLSRVAAAVEGDVKRTMLIQASLIAAEMKSIAPVSHDKKPGELKNSIRVVEGEATAKKAFVVKIEAGDASTIRHVENGKAGYAYDYQYPRAVEFGTQDMPAEPFFWPIWRLRRHGARLAINRAAVKAVRKVWGDK